MGVRMKRDMAANMRRWAGAALAGMALTTASSASAQDLDERLARIEGIKAVERLQYAFGYYQNRFLFTQPPTLFTDHQPEVHYDGGIWVGAAAIKRLWQHHFPKAFGTDGQGPRGGVMFDQPMFQAKIEIGADGETATARFQTIGRYGVYGEDERWIGGVFENDYVKEAGVWKIKVLRYCTSWAAPYNRGWKDGGQIDDLPWMTYSGEGRPDRVDPASCPRAYPDGGVMGFRHVHPVTGKPVMIQGGSQ